jgi:Ca-activated chloride channel family protein
MPDLFAGAPLVLMGRYHGSAHGSVTLQASSAAGRAWSETVASRVSDNPAIACVWARGHIRQLEDRFVVGQGDCSKLEKRIVDTSLKFGVLCRFTAFVAVDKSEAVNKGGEGHRIVQPVEAPQGWGMLERECVGAMPSAAAQAAAPGASRIMLAKRVLGEANADGRVSKRTQVAMDDAAREAMAAPSAPPVANVPTRRGPKDQATKEKARPRDKEGGILRRIFGAFGQGSRAADAVATEDLAAYRPRARVLLERLQSCTATDPAARLSELGVLLVRLQELLEDMKSVAVGGKAIEPLQQLVADLRKLLTQDQPAPGEVDRVWSQADMVLRAFVGDVPERAQFWK